LLNAAIYLHQNRYLSSVHRLLVRVSKYRRNLRLSTINSLVEFSVEVSLIRR